MCDLGSADGDGSGCQAALVANQALGLAVARGVLLRALEDAGGRAIAAALAEGVAAGDLGGVRVGQAGRPGDISFDLTNAHIPPQRGSGGQSGYAMYASQGGSVAKLQGVGGGGGGGRGLRGAAMFSNDSRRRCLQLLGSVDKNGTAPPLFVGLTYPGVWPDDPAVWNDHLDSFYKRLCRKYPWANIAVIWRKEPQERGAPHFHLFVFGLNYLPYQWVGENWAEISSGNARSCSRVERVRSWRGAMFYASKYLAKPTADGVGFTTATGTPLPEVGRHWGVKGRRHLPVTWVRYALALGEFHWLRRQIARYMRSKGRIHRVRGSSAGVWCFLPSEDVGRLMGVIAPYAPHSGLAPRL